MCTTSHIELLLLKTFYQYIYIHAGTLKGAKIINPLLKDGDIIAVSELMGKDIAKILKPNEAEDFLCICKDSIESLDL